MKDRGTSIPKYHCDGCDFGTDYKNVFDNHYESDYHRKAVFARKQNEKN